MARPSQELICERLRDAVSCCPVCSDDIRETNTPDDGIPDEQAFEHVFGCGSRVAVYRDGSGYRVSYGCPQAGQSELDNIYEETIDELESEFPPGKETA